MGVSRSVDSCRLRASLTEPYHTGTVWGCDVMGAQPVTEVGLGNARGHAAVSELVVDKADREVSRLVVAHVSLFELGCVSSSLLFLF